MKTKRTTIFSCLTGLGSSRGFWPGLLALALGFGSARAQGVQVFSENFDDVSTLTGKGWAQINNSVPVGSLGWFQGTPISATGPFDAQTGAANAYIAANYNSTGSVGTISNWLEMPSITIANGDVLTFYTRKPTPNPTDYADRLELRLSTNGASTNAGLGASAVGDFSTLLLSINPTLVAGGYPTDWTQYSVTVSGLSAPVQGRLAFRYFVTSGGLNGTNSDYIGIDTVSYSGAQYWNGTTTSGDGTIHGGDGTWNNTTTNWTDGGGVNSQAWAGAHGVFSGSSGTVTVAEAVNFTALDFTTDYTLQGPGSLVTTGSSPINVTGSSQVAIATSVTGTGGISKEGLGTLTLSGTNTYSGATTINGGVVSVTTLANSGSSSGIGSGTSLVFGGGTLQYVNSATTFVNVGINRAVTVNAGGGAFDVTNSFVTLNLNGALSGSGTLTKAGAGGLGLLSHSGFTGAVSITGGTVILFDTTPSWSVNAFTLAAGTTLALNSPGSGTNTYTLASLSGAGSIRGSASSGVSNGITVGSDNTSTVYNGNIFRQGGGTFGLTKVGTGTLTLGGSNTYDGTTEVDAGSLQAGGTNGFSSNSAFVVAVGAKLDLNNFNETIASLAGAGSVTLGSGTLTAGGSGDSTIFSGIISGTGGLTKAGSGTLTLSGSNSYTGGTTISAGTLQLGNGSTTGSITGNVVDNGVLAFNRSDTLAFNGTISGTGGVTKLGTNQLTLNGTNSYSGGTTIMSGNVVGNNASAFGTGAITMNLATGSQVVLALSNTVSIANNILVSASNAILTNINTDAVSTFTGSITLLGGNVTVRALSGVGSTSVTGNISGTGNLTLNTGQSVSDTASGVLVSGSVNNVGTITHIGTFSTGSATISGVIGTNVTGVTQNSVTSALVLTGNNLYTGTTTISAGTVQVGNGGTNGSIIGDVLDNGTLAFNRSGAISFGGVVSGTGTLAQLGSGTLTISAGNTYSGGTRLAAGTLVVDNNGALGTGVVSLETGATLASTTGTRTLANSLKILGNATIQIGTSSSQTFAFNGGVDLASGGRTLSFLPNTLSFANFNGVISNDNGGGLGLQLSGTSGAVIVDFSGSASNTYTGTTAVGSGIQLTLDKTNGTTAVAGDLWVKNGGSVQVNPPSGTFSSNEIADTSRVQIDTGGSLQIGALGAATETVNSIFGGGKLILGTNSNSGKITVNSGSFSGVISGSNASSSLTKSGTGTLTLSGSNSFRGGLGIQGGIVSVSSATNLGGGTISFNSGTLLVTNDLSTGKFFSVGTGGATMLVSNSKTLTLSGRVNESSGPNTLNIGDISHKGTILLSGTDTHTGATLVNAGTFTVNGLMSGSSAVTVASGAKLGGSGTLTGAVTIANGGILSPGNSPGILTVGSLTLNSMAQTNFDLGTPQPPGVAGVDSDLIVVTNDLTLGGVFNLVTGTSFGTGTYTLFNYGGTLTNNNPLFGLAPAGYNLVINTATTGQVSLTVDYTGLQYWDGSQTTADGSVQGGSGTWNNANTNWTNENGSANTNWAGLTAVFSNTGGTVTITGTKAIAGLQFAADDYKLKGNGVLAVSASDTEIRIDPGLTATIANTISGSGGIVKTGGGIIALTGSSNYTGGTTLNAGTLRIGDEHALGTGGLVINGGTLGNAGVGSLDRFANAVTANADFGVQVRGRSGEFDIDGALALGTGTRTITFTGPGLASFGGAISGENLHLTSDASGISAVQFTGSDSNSFTGALTVGNGVQLLLAKTDGATAVAGDLIIRRGAAVGLNSNGQIATTSSVRVNGGLDLFQADDVVLGSLSGTGTILGHVGTGTLTVNSGNFSGSIVESGGASSQSLVKATSGTLALSGANSYVGGTVINGGVLITNHASALGSGAVTLNAGGTLAPVQPLTINSLTWNGGTIAMNPTVSLLTVEGSLTMTATGVFEISSVAANTSYALMTFSNTGSVITDFTANTLSGLAATFGIVDNGDGTSTLRVAYIGSSSGGTLSNYAPIFTPTDADFTVNGTVSTSNAPNTVGSLTFLPNGLLNVFNNLFVTSGNFTVNSGTGTIGGPGTVITPSDFNKLGAGVLSLLGNVFANGNANILGGTLSVDGTLTAQNVIVALQSYLKGHGVIFGNVINAGNVAPGNSPGTLTVMGDYVQTPTGALDIEIASPSVFDQLIVSGHASLNGALNIIGYNGYKLKYGQQFTFLQAGSVGGSFTSINMPASNLRGRILESDGNVTLVVAPKSYVQVAQTQNQKNVAKALNRYISATKGDKQTVSTALDLQSESQYPGSFDQISANFYQSLGNTTIELANAQNQVLAQRMSAVRLGIKGFNAVGMQAVLVNDRDGKNVNEAKGEKDILQITPETKWGVWVQGNGIFAKVTSVSDVPTYRYQSGGFNFGADYAWNEHFSTGVYAGYQGTYAKYSTDSSSEINQALFGGYASYQQDGFYADGIIGGGYSGYDTRRSINFSTISRTATAKPYGGQFNTYLDAGYDVKVNKFTFGPLVSGQYTYAGIAAFNESGAQSLDLNVAQQNVDSLRTNLGGRIAYTWNVTEKITILPEIRLAWQHEFLNNSRTIGASLNGGSGSGFNYQTPNPGRDSVLATAGVSAQLGERWNGNFYYTADFGSQSFLSHMISAGLEWKF